MELGERKCRILGAIVHDYVATAEPVGSESLAQKYNLGSQARHHSQRDGGDVRTRIPSTASYLRRPSAVRPRLPILRRPPRCPHHDSGSRESDRARHGFDNCETEVEELIQQTCRILSSLTRYTSVATPPKTDSVCVKHVMVSIVSPSKLLVVTVLNTGHVRPSFRRVRRLADTDRRAGDDQPRERALAGHRLGYRAAQAKEPLPRELAGLKVRYDKVVQTGPARPGCRRGRRLYMDGTGNILRQPEFHQGERIAVLL